MGRSVILGQTRTATTSAGYIGHWPCFQATTDTTVLDRSGKGNALSLNSLAAATAWATANRLAKPVTANQHPTLPKATLGAAWQWNATRRDSLLIAGRIRLTLTGGSQNWLGNCNSTTEGGIKFLVSAGGAWQIGFYDKVAAASQFSASTVVDASWGSNDHSFALLLDGPNNTFSRYVDGALIEGPVALSSVTTLEPQAATFDWVFGGNQPGATGTACTMFALHMLAAAQSAGSPRKPDELARRLHRSPLALVTAAEWPV